MPLVDDVRLALRFARDLKPFLRPRAGRASWSERIAASLGRRREAFATLVERAVFGWPRSPYRPLFARANLGPGELVALVAAHGVEGALHRRLSALVARCR